MKSKLTIFPILAAVIFAACREDTPRAKHIQRATLPPEATPSREELAREQAAAAAPEQQSAAGAQIIADIQARYPGIRGIEVSLFGEATSSPSMGLYLPASAFHALTPDQIAALTAHLRSHIPKARANPGSYMTMTSSAPFYARGRQNVGGIRDDAWFIGTGRVEDGKLYYDRAELTGSDYRK